MVKPVSRRRRYTTTTQPQNLADQLAGYGNSLSGGSTYTRPPAGDVSRFQKRPDPQTATKRRNAAIRRARKRTARAPEQRTANRIRSVRKRGGNF